MAEQPAAEPIEGSADGTSPLEPELDPTAEELGPTDVAELQASGFKVDEEVAQAAGFPAEGAEGYAPAEGEQPYLEADPQGYPMMPQEGGEYVPAEGYPGQDAYGADYGQYPGAEGGYDPAMYAAAVAGDPGAGAPGDAAGAPGQAYTEQLLAQEREKHEAQLQVEAKAREELEDMILRIEKHFKAEQAARKKAEELLQASIAAEMESKSKVEEVLKKRAQEQRMLEEERAAIKRVGQVTQHTRPHPTPTHKKRQKVGSQSAPDCPTPALSLADLACQTVFTSERGPAVYLCVYVCACVCVYVYVCMCVGAYGTGEHASGV